MRWTLLMLTTLAMGCARAGVNGIGNFQAVEPGKVYRGAAPTRVGLESLREQGVRTVVDLRFENAGDEPQLAERLGMRYVNIPCHAERPTDAQMARILSIMTCESCQPVFVHCQRGRDRTGTAVAVYRIVKDEWETRRAIAECRSIQGAAHALWYWQIPRYLGALEAATMLTLLRASACVTCPDAAQQLVNSGDRVFGAAPAARSR